MHPLPSLLTVGGAEPTLLSARFDKSRYTFGGESCEPEFLFDGFAPDLIVPGEGAMVDVDNPDYSAMTLDLTTAAIAALPSQFRVVMRFYLESESPASAALVIFDAFDAGTNSSGFSATRGADFESGLAATRQSGLTLDLLPGDVTSGWHAAEFYLPNPVGASLDHGAATVGPSVPSPAVGEPTAVEFFMQVYGSAYAKVGVKSIDILAA